eukprot:TRINITY_DN2797_c0_g1_i2.p1 TRINITY_DN2797_c0_g1~~TRINITY_DN2797_c0_g1_i2.p1  ORF type:complete len:1133 (-),score=273.04 TRINITY_DN2797_c0_g1_i2:73-3471(-)
MVNENKQTPLSIATQTGNNEIKKLLTYNPCKTIKLLMLGDANVGKTSLLQALQTKRTPKMVFPPKPTIGIDINTEKFPIPQVKGADVQVWDFSGYHEYCAMHQHFLSHSRCIYVICISLARDWETQINFWTDFLNHTVRYKKSNNELISFILVGTKLDYLSEEQIQLAEKAFQQACIDHGFNSFALVSCVSEHNRVMALKESISDVIKGMVSQSKISESEQELLNKVIKQRENVIYQGSSVDTNNAYDVNCLSLLHDLGHVVFNRETGALCIDPGLLAKVISLFIGPEDNRNFLTQFKDVKSLISFNSSPVSLKSSLPSSPSFPNASSSLTTQSVYPIILVEQKISSFLQSKNIPKKVVRSFINLMTDLGICFISSSPRQSGFLFPSLRPPAMFRWPPSTESSKTWACRLFDRTSKNILPQDFCKLQTLIWEEFHSKTKDIHLHSNGIELHINSTSLIIIRSSPTQSSVDILIHGSNVIDLFDKFKFTLKTFVGDTTSWELREIDIKSLFRSMIPFPLDFSSVKMLENDILPSLLEVTIDPIQGSPEKTVKNPWDFHINFEEANTNGDHVINTPSQSESLLKENERKEFKRVSKAFKQLIGTEYSDSFVIEKIVLLNINNNNNESVKNFKTTYDKLRVQQFNRSVLTRNVADEAPWAEWTLSFLESKSLLVPGEECANLTMAWHLAPFTTDKTDITASLEKLKNTTNNEKEKNSNTIIPTLDIPSEILADNIPNYPYSYFGSGICLSTYGSINVINPQTSIATNNGSNASTVSTSERSKFLEKSESERSERSEKIKKKDKEKDGDSEKKKELEKKKQKKKDRLSKDFKETASEASTVKDTSEVSVSTNAGFGQTSNATNPQVSSPTTSLSSSNHSFPPLLLCWVLAGNSYPVTNFSDTKNKHSKVCDSFYALVENSNNVNSTSDPPSLYPYEKYTSDQSTSSKPVGPDYDLLILQNHQQILPRYLVYYSYKPPTVKPKNIQTFLIVVDENDKLKDVVKKIKDKSTSTRIISFNSCEYAKKWMNSRGTKLIQDNKDANVVLLTTLESRRDEGSGLRLCQWVKHPDSEWNNISFYLFEAPSDKITLQSDDHHGIYVNSNEDVLIDFVENGKFNPSKGKNMVSPRRRSIGSWNHS